MNAQMNQEKYVLHLMEDSMYGNNDKIFLGYWTGTRHRGEDVCYPGIRDDKHDDDVKVFTSKKRAQNAVEKLKDKFTYVTSAEIEVLD
jgi:hypothetical protein